MEEKGEKKRILQYFLYSVLGESCVERFMLCVRTQYKYEFCSLSLNLFED